MKVLLVYPNVIGTLTPQMGILTLGSYLLKHGVDVSICDLSFVEADQYADHLESQIAREKPDILAFSCRTTEFNVTSVLAVMVRKRYPDLLIIAGGPHATFQTAELAPYVDYCVVGDGEEALLDIVKLVSRGRHKKIGSLNNIAYQKEEELIQNPMRPLFQLENSPMPVYELFDERHYKNANFLHLIPGAKVCGAFEGSRGCPYKCTYCSSPTLMEMSKGAGKWRREKPAKQIRAEIDHFKSLYGLDMIYFVDEVMMTSDARTKALREHMEDLKTPFIFMERPELIKENRVIDMKAAGAYSCSIGIESGNEEFRQKLLKRKIRDTRIIESYDLMREHGIKTHSFIMIGLPEQTPEVMKETFDLLREIQPDSAQATTFFPLPATELHKHTLQTGLLNEGEYPFAYYGESLLNYPKKHKRMIRRYADIINIGLWQKKFGYSFLFFLSRTVPRFSTLLLNSQIVLRAIKRKGVIGTLNRIRVKLKAIRSARGA